MSSSTHFSAAPHAASARDRQAVQSVLTICISFSLIIGALLLAGCSPQTIIQRPGGGLDSVSADATAAVITTARAITDSKAATATVSADPVVKLLAATVIPVPTAGPAVGAVRLPTSTPAAARLALLLPTPTPGRNVAPSRKGKVSNTLVNARRSPALDAEIVTLLEVGFQFEIVDASANGEWLQICCVVDDNEAAWVNAALVEEERGAVADGDAEIEAGAIEGPAGLINAALVNVRGGPGTGYLVLDEVSQGERVQLTGRNDDGSWLQICCVNGQRDGDAGWVSIDFIDTFLNDTLANALPAVEAPPIPEQVVQAASSDAGGGNQAAQLAAAPAPGLPGDGGFGQSGGTNPLTGLPLDGGRVGQRPVIVCINNDYAARPQFGISQADVMYEYLMEGFGITRFSGVFYGENVGQIGPVRSARLINYYMAPLYKAGLACSGASDRVRYALKHEMPAPYMDIDLDDASNTRYSVSIGGDYRTRLRTSSDGLRRWLAEWGVEQPATIRGFSFGDIPGGGAPASSIAVPYPRATGSQVGYQYDAGNGRYLRSLGGGPHLDGNSGAQVGVENVVIQFAPHEITDIVEDSLGSRSIRLNLFGSGRAIVFRDGQAYSGVWRSDSQGDMPRFYTDDGSEIPLKPGHTWVSVVPLGYGIEYQ